MTYQTSTAGKPKSIAKAIITAGLIAGTLDILSAFTSYYLLTGKSPVDVLYFVASGVFGKAAFAGGTAMAIWGLIFHFIIAFSFTIFFFLIYPKLSFLQKNWIISGLLYGIFVWLVMNLVVVPLSNTPPGRFTPSGIVRGAAILMLMIGLPVSFFAKRHYER